ncbi:MAG: hypothetical protein IMW90_20320 [Thermogemmatispora sp.]|uniref:hypothetical protein n=1 Tax=Thermogemmatispora sp. TaxID=1968838 RepID=UPI0019EF2432|nr:hypothetical protein [Thermogemmatispora sp.]MBE3568069.1 hypothetical protein [Thermogemmatispora sp.]
MMHTPRGKERSDGPLTHVVWPPPRTLGPCFADAIPLARLRGTGGARPTPQRRSLPDVPYLLPKDPLEDQRLNYQHHALYRTLSNHYLAPLAPERVCTILDVGTGIWAVELRALFPHALIVGGLPCPVRPGAIIRGRGRDESHPYGFPRRLASRYSSLI